MSPCFSYLAVVIGTSGRDTTGFSLVVLQLLR